MTGKDLGHKPSVLEKTKIEYSPLVMSLIKAFKKDDQMSLDSKYNRMREFNRLLISFKSLKTKKTKTQLKKERIMKNNDGLYKNYYNAYKSDYDTDDDLKEHKKKKFGYKQFKLDNEINRVKTG